jgi:hypothetical protein
MHKRIFFIVEFILAEDKDQIINSGTWFWGIARLCMMLWTLTFDPTSNSLSTASVWVRMPNIPLHFWGFDLL